MSWFSAYAVVSALLSTEGRNKKQKIVTEKRCSLQNRMITVQMSSVEESVETLEVFQNDVYRQMLQVSRYNPKRKDESHVRNAIMEIDWLNARIKIVIRCVSETKNRGK